MSTAKLNVFKLKRVWFTKKQRNEDAVIAQLEASTQV